MSVRISVESLSGCAWNGCPSQRGIRKLVPEDHLVRVIEAYVARLDLRVLGFSKAQAPA